MQPREVSITSPCPVPQEVTPPSFKVAHRPPECIVLFVKHCSYMNLIVCDVRNNML